MLGTTNQFLSSATLYDDLGRSIQVQSINQTGGLDVATMQYDFEGKLLRSHLRHRAVFSANKDFEVGGKNTYDNLGRVVKAEKQLNGGGWEKVTELEYNAIGQVKKKKVGNHPEEIGDPLESLNYAYNIRGWLLGVNRDFAKHTLNTDHYFGFDLGYDKTAIQASGQSAIGAFNTAAYNGNIAGVVWKSGGDGVIRKFDFDYDPINRLLKGDFTQLEGASFTNSHVNFNMKMGDGSNPLSAYDANGNIKRMQQWGLKITGSVQIDDLSYNYNNYSNKLKNVIDTQNDTTTRLGDFRSSKLYMTALSNTKTTAAIDYLYDGNGNLIKDRNKDIGDASNNGIVYNHLNLPKTVTVRTAGGGVKGTIEYTYDASGVKLKKVLTEGAVVTTTIYMTGTFVNDTLQYIAYSEGRIRYRKQQNDYVNDYFLTDHLGNVRMVLTEEEQTDTYVAATFEDAATSNEQLYYENADVERVARPGSFYSSGTNGSKVQLLRKSVRSIGVGKLLKVMAGDRLNTKVDYYIPNETTNNNNANGLNAILTQLLSMLNGGGAPAALKGAGASVTSDLGTQSLFTNFLSPQSGGGGAMPKAYLNILFFDEQFRFVPENSEIIPVSVKGSGQTIYRVDGDACEAKKNGYVYVYVSNESDNFVYFDNLQVSHERGRILEETHYYPFGLAMAGISSKAAGKMATSFKFNGGSELNDDLGIATYETMFRGYDAQIGRFGQVDPMVDKYHEWSPYCFAFNDPVYWNDPLGADPDPYEIRNAQDLINYINQYGIGGFPDGFLSFTFGDDGNLTNLNWDPNPSMGFYNGVWGLLVNWYTGVINDGDRNVFLHENLSTVVVGANKFIAADNLYDNWSQWNSASTQSLQGGITSAQYAFAGILALSDGPEPFVMDIVAVGYLAYSWMEAGGSKVMTQFWVDIMMGGMNAYLWMKGERGKTAKPDGTNNPWKHTKPHPSNPNKIQEKDGHTGKWKDKPKPSGWDDWWKNR